MLTSKANKILIDEILPLVTKAFSSITSELMTRSNYWDDKDENVMKLYQEKGDDFVSCFKTYVEGTVRLQYKALTEKAVKRNDVVVETIHDDLTGETRKTLYKAEQN